MKEDRSRERHQSLPVFPPLPLEVWPGTKESPPSTPDGNIADDDEQPPPRWGNHQKSCIDRTRASTVLHKVTWPHEVVYTSEGMPAAYKDLSISLFAQGYLIVIDTEERPPTYRT